MWLLPRQQLPDEWCDFSHNPCIISHSRERRRTDDVGGIPCCLESFVIVIESVSDPAQTPLPLSLSSVTYLLITIPELTEWETQSVILPNHLNLFHFRHPPSHYTPWVKCVTEGSFGIYCIWSRRGQRSTDQHTIMKPRSTLSLNWLSERPSQWSSPNIRKNWID